MLADDAARRVVRLSRIVGPEPDPVFAAEAGLGHLAVQLFRSALLEGALHLACEHGVKSLIDVCADFAPAIFVCVLADEIVRRKNFVRRPTAQLNQS